MRDRIGLVCRQRTRCQGVTPEDHCLESLSALGRVLFWRVQRCLRGAPASLHSHQGFVCRVEVLEHFVHGGCGHCPVGMLLGRGPARAPGRVHPAQQLPRPTGGAEQVRRRGRTRGGSAWCRCRGWVPPPFPCCPGGPARSGGPGVGGTDPLRVRHDSGPDSLPHEPW